MRERAVAVFYLDSMSDSDFQFGPEDGYSRKEIEFVLPRLERSALVPGMRHSVFTVDGGGYVVYRDSLST